MLRIFKYLNLFIAPLGASAAPSRIPARRRRRRKSGRGRFRRSSRRRVGWRRGSKVWNARNMVFFSFIGIHVYSLPDSRGSEGVPQRERPSPSVEILQGEGAKGGLGSATEN